MLTAVHLPHGSEPQNPRPTRAACGTAITAYAGWERHFTLNPRKANCLVCLRLRRFFGLYEREKLRRGRRLVVGPPARVA